MTPAIHRGMPSKVVQFVVAVASGIGSGLVVPNAAAQVTVRGVIAASDPCQLLEQDKGVMCAAVLVPLEATVRFVPALSRMNTGQAAMRSRPPRKVTLRSSSDGRFVHRRVPKGVYAVELSRVAYGGAVLDAQGFSVSPRRVRVSARSGSAIFLTVKRKGRDSSEAPSNPVKFPGKDAVTIERQSIGDCAAVPVPE